MPKLGELLCKRFYAEVLCRFRPAGCVASDGTSRSDTFPTDFGVILTLFPTSGIGLVTAALNGKAGRGWKENSEWAFYGRTGGIGTSDAPILGVELVNLQGFGDLTGRGRVRVPLTGLIGGTRRFLGARDVFYNSGGSCSRRNLFTCKRKSVLRAVLGTGIAEPTSELASGGTFTGAGLMNGHYGSTSDL